MFCTFGCIHDRFSSYKFHNVHNVKPNTAMNDVSPFPLPNVFGLWSETEGSPCKHRKVPKRSHLWIEPRTLLLVDIATLLESRINGTIIILVLRFNFKVQDTVLETTVEL